MPNFGIVAQIYFLGMGIMVIVATMVVVMIVETQNFASLAWSQGFIGMFFKTVMVEIHRKTSLRQPMFEIKNDARPCVFTRGVYKRDVGAEYFLPVLAWSQGFIGMFSKTVMVEIHRKTSPRQPRFEIKNGARTCVVFDFKHAIVMAMFCEERNSFTKKR